MKRAASGQAMASQQLFRHNANRSNGRWMGALLLLVWLLAGCGSLGEVQQSLLAQATLTPTPIPTPTATVTPTATPPPTPTLPPIPLSVAVAPSSPAQGQTLLIRVQLGRAAQLSGDFDGQPLTFAYLSPTDAWALVGVPPWSALGERRLVLEAVAADGQRAHYQSALPVQETTFAVQAINVPPEQDSLLLTGLRPAEDEYLASVLREVSPEPLWDGPFGIPAQGIRTSPYGARRSYQGGPLTGYHGGLDWAAPEGTPIYATAPGVVVLAESLVVRGNVVVLDHGLGVHTLYFHLSALAVTPGQRVAQGDFLGAMGTTGLSTGSHLHWEVRIGEIFVNPDEWLAQDFRP